MTKKIQLTPSVASANPLFLAEELKAFNKDIILHMDIEDGTQGKNITFGMKTTLSAAKLVDNPMDFHLLVRDPSIYYEEIAKLNTRYVFIPLEAITNPMVDLDQIRMLGMKPALSLTIDTPIDHLKVYVDEIEAVLLLTYGSPRGGVNGLGFRRVSYERIRECRQLLRDDQEIYVDGGVGIEELKESVQCGADGAILGRVLFPEAENGLNPGRILMPSERTKTPGEILKEIEEELG